MVDRYTLHYWPIPFRGHFVRMILAHVGATWLETGFPEMAALKDREVADQPYPFMAPPLLHDHSADRWLSQLPAIVMYLGRKYDLSRDADTDLRLICDACDILVEITRGHGARMWDRDSWAAFRDARLPRWMQLHERLVQEMGLDAGEVTLAQLVLAALWYTMTDCLPGLRPVLEDNAPATCALVERIAARPEIAAMLGEWRGGPHLYCAGQIEASLMEMLEKDETDERI